MIGICFRRSPQSFVADSFRKKSTVGTYRQKIEDRQQTVAGAFQQLFLVDASAVLNTERVACQLCIRTGSAMLSCIEEAPQLPPAE